MNLGLWNSVKQNSRSKTPRFPSESLERKSKCRLRLSSCGDAFETRSRAAVPLTELIVIRGLNTKKIRCSVDEESGALVVLI